MYKQIIFCLETDKQAATDWIYISETIAKYYSITNEIKLSQIFMGSKTKYNSNKVVNEIKKKEKDYTLGQTIVIYCIDVDDFESNPDHVYEFNIISQYCVNKNYEFIWFCHDVEDVYWGKRINNTEKYNEARKFRKNNIINSIQEDVLSSKNYNRIHSSNIILILDKHLERL